MNTAERGTKSWKPATATVAGSRSLAVNLFAIAHADNVNRLVRGIEVVDDAKIADAQGQHSAPVAFQRLACEWLAGERVYGVQERRKDGMVPAGKRLQILLSAGINDDAPTI